MSPFAIVVINRAGRIIEWNPQSEQTFGWTRDEVLGRMVHETAKMGSDNPDNYYQNAKISGEFEYRIKGNRDNPVRNTRASTS